MECPSGKRADRHSGHHQFVHNLVTSGVIQWKHGAQGADAVSKGHEVICPPVQLDSTTAEQIAAGLSLSLEKHLLDGLSLEVWMDVLSRNYGRLNFFVVADSAASNVRLLWRLLAYIQKQGKRVNVLVTGCYAPCLLHQVSRMLTMTLERQGVNAALYSVTRLNQHSVFRKKTWVALQAVLRERYVYVAGPIPPGTARSSAPYRESLMKVLTGWWDWETNSHAKEQNLRNLFSHFNGDIMDEGRLTHYCHSGCCENAHHSLNKVPWQNQLGAAFAWPWLLSSMIDDDNNHSF